jgi:methyl-accepting chemotaxis protein
VREITEITGAIKSGLEEVIEITGEGEKLSEKGRQISRDAKQSLESIMGNIGEIDAMVRGISSSIKGQEDATRKVSIDARAIAGLSKAIKETISLQAEEAEAIRRSIAKLSGAAQGNESLGSQLTEHSLELQRSSSELSTIVGLFKLEV